MTSGLAIARSSIEVRTIRKLRFRILPFVFLLFIVALLDRFNIGFAALTMNKELAITSQQYGLVFGIFFVGYFIFELPSNLLLHKIGARIWIARILITWGVVAALTGFAQTGSSTLRCSLSSRLRRSRLLSWNCPILDLLVSPTRTGAGPWDFNSGQSYHQYSWGPGFGSYSRLRALAWPE
jgi:MFS family permease